MQPGIRYARWLQHPFCAGLRVGLAGRLLNDTSEQKIADVGILEFRTRFVREPQLEDLRKQLVDSRGRRLVRAQEVSCSRREPIASDPARNAAAMADELHHSNALEARVGRRAVTLECCRQEL